MVDRDRVMLYSYRLVRAKAVRLALLVCTCIEP